jgi:hypothetical protein
MATTARRGVRLWLFRLVTVLVALVVGFLIAECTIRIFPNLLNDKLRHAAFSKYDTLPGGIFRFEGITRTRFMRADHRTRAYSHDYFWTHEADTTGYRNPSGIDDRRVLLLGDSIVYGHGVESDETIAHYLRTNHGVAAYDISAQGQCLYDHYLALRLKLQQTLETICRRHELELIDTREFFNGRTDWILPGDGHFNPEGNRVFAEFLSQGVLGQPSSLR